MIGFGWSKLGRKTCCGRHVVNKERENHDRTKIRWGWTSVTLAGFE